LNGPRGVSFDSSGNVYIADSLNHVVRKITYTGTTDTIKTIAGTPGTPGFNGDGIAASSAYLYSPYGVTVAPSGDIIVCDSQNNRIRTIKLSTGIITTIVGTGVPATSADGLLPTLTSIGRVLKVTFDTSGAMYFGDFYSNVVRVLSPNGNNITTLAGVPSSVGVYSGDGGPASAAQMNHPQYTAIDVYGNVYVTEVFGYEIRKILGKALTLKIHL
jgi:NHL repeat